MTLTLPSANNEIKIFDLQGKLLLLQNVGFSAEVNVSMLPKGTYVLMVNNLERRTFIKQ
ncbi:MAG: T9SS type A sorting domain-containing protein [Bacteroidales bacterium]|nr:T9SS type A sorting domain-containing protein [Bacteroidales bacterium]